MNVFVVQLTFDNDGEAVNAAIVQNASLDRPASITEGLMTSDFSECLAQVNLNEVVGKLKTTGSYFIHLMNKDGNNIVFGFSTYSLYAALGAAHVARYRESEINITTKTILL